MVLLYLTLPSFVFQGAYVGDVICVGLQGAPSPSYAVATSFFTPRANSSQFSLPIISSSLLHQLPSFTSYSI
jgi:hypothetical protein